MPRSNHKPMRTCLGCLQRDEQAAMVRVAVTDGRVQPDEEAGRRSGRGGYLHRSAACLARFERSKVKEFRSLRLKLGLDERRELTELIRSRLATIAQLE
jgi:predicted RNA-binding protein YlxR (DUF448 family)